MPMSSIGVDIWGTDTAGTQLTMERGDLDGICEATGRGALDLGMDGPVLPLWMRKETANPIMPMDGICCSLCLIATGGRAHARRGLRVEFYLLDPASDGIAPARPQLGGPPRAFDNIYSLEELNDAGPFIDDLYRRQQQPGSKWTRPLRKARSGSSSSTSCTSRMR